MPGYVGFVYVGDHEIGYCYSVFWEKNFMGSVTPEVNIRPQILEKIMIVLQYLCFTVGIERCTILLWGDHYELIISDILVRMFIT